jgi:ABC-type branched-subunit amino acid transport system ATPase component
MKVFVAASYSSKVNYDTGEVFPEYKEWLENILTALERQGHQVTCALREDNYRINDADPAGAAKDVITWVQASDAMLALLSDKISGGVQTEIGMCVAWNKKVVLAHEPAHDLGYFNDALVKAGLVHELMLPLDEQQLAALLNT